MRVTLNRDEMTLAAIVGVLRRVQNLFLQGGPRLPYGRPELDQWGVDVQGAAGEMAFAKGFNLFWSGALGRWGVADVDRFQVRTTVHQCLVLHDEDTDDQVFVLVRGAPPRYELVGWTLAGDGKANREKEDRGSGRPCYYVPPRDLRPMHELLAHL